MGLLRMLCLPGWRPPDRARADSRAQSKTQNCTDGRVPQLVKHALCVTNSPAAEAFDSRAPLEATTGSRVIQSRSYRIVTSLASCLLTETVLDANNLRRSSNRAAYGPAGELLWVLAS